MTDFILTKQNYHTPEANRNFMSVSQYKGFLECEAKSLAKLKEEWIEDESDALLVGKYVHSGIEGTLDRFKQENPQLFTKKGDLLAAFKLADTMLETLLQDDFVKLMLEGEKEKIVTVDLFGTKWKMMWDIYNAEKRRVIDIKTTRSIFDKVWSDRYRAKVSFIVEYEYMIQAAMYAQAEKVISSNLTPPEFYIIAVSKEKTPDKAIINMTDTAAWMMEYKNIQSNLPKILDIKSGAIQPERCGHCDYCKSTKKLTRVIHHSELME